ncbi:MAG TPA: LysR family transcriptional regulator, partial [Candidatus Paceibacterota bacterium]|nr:LysR family transcriptional regulator [Candidatus Paceibacterota bacterium]
MDHLRPFATQRQLEYLNAIAAAGSGRKAARELGITERTLERGLANLRRRAARGGVSPEHDMPKPTAPGYYAKRVSTNYDKPAPGVNQQWVIQEPDKQAQLDALIERLDQAHENWH